MPQGALWLRLQRGFWTFMTCVGGAGGIFARGCLVVKGLHNFLACSCGTDRLPSVVCASESTWGAMTLFLTVPNAGARGVAACQLPMAARQFLLLSDFGLL